MKLRCDGSSPCSSCEKRNLPCNNERKAEVKGEARNHVLDGGRAYERWQPAGQELPAASASAARKTYGQPSDRGSIRFLLNGGTDSFTEQFHLPPRSDRALGVEYHNQIGLREAESPLPGHGTKDDQIPHAQSYVSPDLANMSFFPDFANVFNGPFSNPHKSLDDPYTATIPYQAFIPSGQDPHLTLSSEQTAYEPPRPFATDLFQSILARAWALPLDPKAQQEISTNLSFLLTTARIRKFVSRYFKYWHPHCPLIYTPWFDPETVSLPLLASVVFMGAMYSTDDMEVCAAKKVLDIVELFIFSSDPFACETEIVATFAGDRRMDDTMNDWVLFQNFQAGFLVVLVQYWAGSRVSKNRAMETRFSELVKVRAIAIVLQPF